MWKKSIRYYKIEDVYHFEKYDTKTTTFFSAWIWIQLIMLLLFVSYFFGNIANIGSPDMFIYGGFVFIYVYAYSELMDGNRYRHALGSIKSSHRNQYYFLPG